MEKKKCSNCGKSKPVSAFYAHPKTKDNLQSQCRECMKASATARGVRLRAEKKARLA